MASNPQHPSLIRRPRRLRASSALRDLVRENAVYRSDLIQPYFISEKINEKLPIASMPGVFQFTVDELVSEVVAAAKDGIQAILLFGIPSVKDEQASQAYAENGIVQQAVRAVKKAIPEMLVITDVCLCEYMSHGHCGVVGHSCGSEAACADIVAPSDMMDGRVAAIRSALDAAGFKDTPIMSYAAKFYSSFYGPFRDAAESAPQFGDRRSYQMDFANAEEALREVALDIEESADIVMVKPGLPYLDLLWRVKERFQMPTAVYNVSGEYSMIKAAAQNGWLNERETVLEQMTAFKRAGADLIITYWARDVARWLA